MYTRDFRQFEIGDSSELKRLEIVWERVGRIDRLSLFRGYFKLRIPYSNPHENLCVGMILRDDYAIVVYFGDFREIRYSICITIRDLVIYKDTKLDAEEIYISEEFSRFIIFNPTLTIFYQSRGENYYPIRSRIVRKIVEYNPSPMFGEFFRDNKRKSNDLVRINRAYFAGEKLDNCWSLAVIRSAWQWRDNRDRREILKTGVSGVQKLQITWQFQRGIVPRYAGGWDLNVRFSYTRSYAATV